MLLLSLGRAMVTELLVCIQVTGQADHRRWACDEDSWWGRGGGGNKDRDSDLHRGNEKMSRYLLIDFCCAVIQM